MITTAAVLAATAMAVVVQDQSALRAAPRESAAQQAVLWQGDVLEVRGERIDHVQVWDHRRERAGFVKASQVRLLTLQEPDAPQLLSVLRFLRDTPGAEALGIAYVAAYLKAAPASRIDAEPFDALGMMAERLARRASSSKKAGETVAAHLEVATQYGVKFNSFERDGALQLCYDGEAFRRVLAMQTATAAAQARAALALTRHDCIDPALSPLARLAHDRQRAEMLDRFSAAQFAGLPEPLKQRLRVRRAGVWATLAFERARADDRTADRTDSTPTAAQRAIDELAAVNRNELGDDDLLDYADAAVRVGASRWGAVPALPEKGRLALRTEAGEPGQTCVVIGEPKAPLARRCSYGVVWMSSARVHPDGRSAVIAVQPLPSWTELWVLKAQADGGWRIDVLPPAATEPMLGYLEFAGWVPGARKLLVAREARVEGRLRRSFEVLSLDSLNTEKQASTPQLLQLFGKWQDAVWKQQTLSLR